MFSLVSLALFASAVSAVHVPSMHRSHSDVAALLKRSSPAPVVQARVEMSTADCKSAVKSLGDYTIYSEACVDLIYSCLGHVNSTATPWTSESCVAAATCDGTRNLLDLAQCQNSAVVTGETSAYLSYDIYAAIVGDCAWADGGCSMTQQNFVDFFYAHLTKIGSTNWPASADDVVTNYWNPIKEWVAVDGDDIPYRNFADWLIYSDSYAVDAEDDDSSSDDC